MFTTSWTFSSNLLCVQEVVTQFYIASLLGSLFLDILYYIKMIITTWTYSICPINSSFYKYKVTDYIGATFYWTDVCTETQQICGNFWVTQ